MNLREKIIETIGHGMERERAECLADEVMSFQPVFLSNEEWPDHLICKYCGERVERGIANVSHHYVHCLKNPAGLITASTDFERKVLDSWSINVPKE